MNHADDNSHMWDSLPISEQNTISLNRFDRSVSTRESITEFISVFEIVDRFDGLVQCGPVWRRAHTTSKIAPFYLIEYHCLPFQALSTETL